MRLFAAVFAALLLTCVSPSRADDAPRRATGTVSATVDFSTGFATPLTVDAALLDTLPASRVTAMDHGVQGTWDGVALVDVLRKAGAPLDKYLRGPNLTRYILVTASDGYRTMFTLAELDATFGDAQVMLAFARDGAALSEKEGPYRLIVPGDTKQARWIRQVARVELFDAPGTPAPAHAH